jgi:hypothetical protein
MSRRHRLLLDGGSLERRVERHPLPDNSFAEPARAGQLPVFHEGAEGDRIETEVSSRRSEIERSGRVGVTGEYGG